MTEDTNQHKGPFLTLREGCYLVRGPYRSAVYDLRHGRLYSLDPAVVAVLDDALRGIPWNRLRRAVERGSPTAAVQSALEKSPFVRLQPQFVPPPPIENAVIRAPTRRGGVWLEPTNRCNLRCIHCYASAGPALPGEMSLTQWKQTIDQLFAEGFRHFTICGGEPFVYPHLKELLQHLAAHGAEAITVLTNACLLREDTVRYAAEIGVEFGVTFYSHVREHHEKITRVRGSWQAAVDGMSLLLRLGIPFSVNIPLGSLNQDDLEETLDFLVRLGVPRHRAGGNIVYPLGRGCNPEVLPSQRTIFNIRTEIYEIPVGEDGKLDYHTCWRGKLLVMADGRVTPCPSARDERFVIGNLAQRPLAEILADERLHQLWGITLDDVPECRQCEFRYGCHDCRANAFIYTGDLWGKNPYCSYDPQTGSWKAPALPQRSLRRVEKTPGFSLRVSPDGSGVLNDEKSGALFRINASAALIFEALDEPRALEELAQILCKRFDVTPARAYRDVSRIVSHAVKAGILRWR